MSCFKNENTMTKKLSLTLLFALLLQVTFTLEAKQTSLKEGVNILSVKIGSINGAQERDPAVSADIMGHTLTISIHKNVGIAQINIRDTNNVVVEVDNIISSPETTCIYISDNGFYRVDIVLNNGDLYYGFFTVRDGILI